jgi:NitT/TauT family transport system substrate-binding protein
VAVLIFGGVAHFAARAVAKHYGLDPEKDLKYLAVGPPDARFAALSQGLVDAAVLGPPLDLEARKQGFSILARAHDVYGLVTSVKNIQDKPDEIKRAIRAGIKATRYIRSNREGTIQFIMEWLKVNRETATATYEGVAKVYDDDINVCEKGLRLVIEETKKTVKTNREVAFSDVAASPFSERRSERWASSK